jgi:hypothetical protein
VKNAETPSPREGFDEMDQASAGWLDDGSIEIHFACHKGDEAFLKGELDSSSRVYWNIAPQ